MRLARTLFALGIAFRFRHHFEGPPVDYVGVMAAAAASWTGIPGPGEPVLIAAAVFASRHRLDIGPVLFMAWVGATVGGIAGWLIGMNVGRKVITTRGPLHNMRRKALARGEEVFARHPVAGVLLTTSWIAGIHKVSARVYLPTNAASAVIWAVGIGLGAYYVGPEVIDVVGDLGLVTAIGVGLLIVSAIAIEISRRRRRATAESRTTRTS